MKCTLLRMSLLCSLFLFVFCINVSFAAGINYTNFNEWGYNGTREDLSNSIFDEFLDVSFTNYRDYMNPNLGTSDKNKVDTFFTRFFSNDFTCFYWSVGTNSNNYNNRYIYIFLSTNDFTSTTYRYQFYKLKTSSYYNLTLSSSTSASTIEGSIGNGVTDKYLLNSSGVFYKNGTYIPPNIFTNLTYNNFKTSTISVNYSGENENFIKADYSKNLSSWRLGSFSNFDTSEVDTIYGYLASFQGSSDSGAIYSDVIASFQWKKNIGTYSNGLSMPDTSEHAIYLSSSRIYYNQGYTLYFNAYKNGVEQEITNQFTYLYFVPLGDSSISGELINPQANTNLDWNFINSIEHLYDTSSGNTAFIFNNYNTSGDILGFTYTDYDQWGFGDFIKTSFNNFLDALYNYDNISFDLGILGVHNSSEFIVSNNALITIVSLFSNCFLLLSSIAWFFYTICAIGVLDLDKIIKDKADLGMF